MDRLNKTFRRILGSGSRRLFELAIVTLAAILVFVSVRIRTTGAGERTQMMLPAGYRLEQVITGLNLPTSITWDSDGNLYVLESGLSVVKGTSPTRTRVLKVVEGKTQVAVDNLLSPASDVKFYGGEMYIAHGGCLSVIRDGKRVDLISGLPYGDHFTGEIAFDDLGWVYLGNGTVTNSGVVGPDNYAKWQSLYGLNWNELANRADVPPVDLVLEGCNFTSPDPRTKDPSDTTSTGGFVPFGTTTSSNQIIPGNPKASGVILRVRPTGQNLQVYAWGLRNPFAMKFDSAGRLIAIDQGFDDRGSRPIANAPDAVFSIKEGGWYGWPDYAAGKAVTDPSFRSSADKGAGPQILLKEHPPVETPIALLSPDSGAMKFDFAPKGFDPSTRMFIAIFGEPAVSAGTTAKPVPSASAYPGVLALDLATGRTETFAYNKAQKPVGRSIDGLNHPIDVKFGPDGCLYILDFGVIETSGSEAKAVPGTGAVWKVIKQRSEYHEFVMATMAKLESAQNTAQAIAWNPDYSGLRATLESYIAQRPEVWGLYFKDIVSGKSFGINEYVQVPAASTVKVAVVLYASHLVSQGKLDWNERLTYYAERDWRGGAGTMQFTAKDGDTFTIRELAEKAIRDSDNVAWKMLERRLGKQNIINFMRQIGGEVVYPGGENISTPKDNATYMEAALKFALNNKDGEKLLFDLANTVWNTGLNRYINEATVAHKEGDITGVADDVGIVYADFPYIISIMSRGHGDVEVGFEKIGEISRIIFDYQNNLAKAAAATTDP